MSFKRFNIYLFVFLLSGLKFTFLVEKARASMSVNKTYTIKVNTKHGPLITQIHTSDKNEEMVNRISQILNHETQDLINYFEWVPDDILHIIIKSDTYASNGSATVFPRLKIVLHDRPPTGYSYLNSSSDWLKNLMLHELVHIIHASQHRGVVDLVDTLFGSIGRSMTGLVPRWFTEGIAVWAETEFTEAGRLRDEMMLMEARKALMREDFCTSSECLSLPDFYPYGHAPYWLGGMFIDYIEKNIPGAVRCIVKANSRKLPFFLSYSFSQCLEGSSLAEVFSLWVKDEREKLAKNMVKLSLNKDFKNLKPLDFASEDTVWNRGAELNKKTFYYVQNNASNAVEKIISFDLDNNKKKEIRTDGPVVGLYQLDGNENILNFSQRSFAGDNPPEWAILKRIKNKTKKITDNPDYVYYLKLDERKQYAFKYKKFVWELFKITKGKEKSIKKFKLNEQIHWPYLNDKGRLQFFVFDWLTKTYHHHTLEGLNLKTDFSHKGYLTLFDRCQDWPIMKMDNLLTTFDGKSLRKIETSLEDEIIFFKGSSRQSLFWLKSSPDKVYVSENDCKGFLNNSNPLKNKNNQTKQWADANNSKTIFEEENFYKFKYLTPDYWFYNVVVGNTMTYYSLFTHLTDPTEDLILNLNVDFYSTIKKVGGTYSLGYNIGSNWNIGAFYIQGYDLSTIDNDVENQRAVGASLSKTMSMGRLDYRIKFNYFDISESDFISSRKAKKYSITNSLNLNRVFADDFFNKFNISAEAYKQNTIGRTNFIGQNYFLRSSYYFSSFWLTHIDLSYGKMDKKELLSGAVFAGDSNNHRFIGLDTSSAFSNELSTARGQFDFELFNTASDVLFLPVMLKQTRLILGAEWLKSKYIYIGSDPYKNKQALSFHSGLRFKTQAFYYLPITIDIFYAKTQIPDRDELERVFIQAGGYIF